MIKKMNSEAIAPRSALSGFQAYAGRLRSVLDEMPLEAVEAMANAIRTAWIGNKQVFLCGNGGSAGNATHLANDLIYGIARDTKGVRAHSLAANSSVLTCLANDVSYPDIFSTQLRVLADKGDLLIVFSGSGNSPNVVKAIQVGKELGMTTCAVLGYSGGACKALADIAVHFAIDDMQIAEDMQLVVGHMIMQYLCENQPEPSHAFAAVAERN